jgi:hypothetical protein
MQARQKAHNARLADPSLTPEQKAKLDQEFKERVRLAATSASWPNTHSLQEREIARSQRKRFSTADFESLVIIGRGAFGEASPWRRNVTLHSLYVQVIVLSVAGEGGALQGGWPHLRHESNEEGGHDTQEPGQLVYAIFDCCVHLFPCFCRALTCKMSVMPWLSLRTRTS